MTTPGTNRRIERIIRLWVALQRGDAPRPRELAAQLGVAEPTLRKDLGLMRSVTEWPMRWDIRHKRWRLGGEATALNLPPGSSLVVAALSRALAVNGHGPARATAALVVQAVEASLDESLQRSFSRLADDTGREVIDALTLAIGHRARVYLEVRARSDQVRPRRLAFDPESFEFVERHLYVVGVHVDKRMRVAQRVDRIRRVVETPMRFAQPLEVENALGEPEHRVGIWGGRTVTEVVCSVTQELVELVQTEPACRDHTLEVSADGSAVFRFRVSNVDAFVRWTMRWMDGMTVLGPPEVVQAVRHLLSGALARHRNTPVRGETP
ncbi:MAG: helix-turn-helix transcriptional regulator [Bradymonadia bacterium]